MYNDKVYINKRNIYYQKYFADVLYSSEIVSAKKSKCKSPFIFDYAIDVSELTAQDCYRMASYQRAVYFRACFSGMKDSLKLRVYNIILRVRKRTAPASDLDA